MTTKKPIVAEQKKMKSEAALRASVSFPPELYHLLERIASQKKVSIAWVVRDAAEKYVAEKWPLLGGRE
jgi:metal-responsive CopG/Arc/MetJ family transcriptional regulator